MAWTADVKARESLPGVVHLLIEFTNGTDVRELSFDRPAPTVEEFTRFVQAELTRLEAVDAFLAVVPAGPVTIKDVPPVVLTDKQAYQQLEFKLTALQADFAKKVALTVVPADDATFTKAIADLSSQVKAAFQPEFVAVDVAVTR